MKKLLFLLCLGSFSWVSAANTLPPDSTGRSKKLTITPFPALFSSPETGIGYGALVIPVYNFGQDSLTRNSNGQVLAFYTQRKQSSVQISYNLFTNREKFIIMGNANYYDYPIPYFGTGNTNNNVKDYTIVDYKLLYFQNRLLRQVKKRFFAGGLYHINKIYQISSTPDSRIYDRPANELDGSIISGLGPAFLYDSRNNPLNSSKGVYIALSSLLSRKALGSEFNFTRYTVDARKFISLSEKQVLGFQALGRFHGGQVPFRELALMGGGGGGAEAGGMRGFFKGRYRDREMIALQSEFRQQVFSRVGLVAFAGVGEVASKMSGFNAANMQYAGGGGIRLMLNRKERLNIRVDYAIGNKGARGLYFDIGEDF